MTEIRSLPPRSDPRWRDLATGKIAGPWQNLAVKLMLARLGAVTRADPTPATIDKAIDDIRAYFDKNLQAAQSDLQNIFR
jgi:hypothetical protein